MAEDTTTSSVDAWVTQHRGHAVTREAERSMRCLTCMSVTWADSPEEADRAFASMKRP
jgi:predicted adenine nucleotide alpha hydrolase (AANH) superfamily ATPase